MFASSSIAVVVRRPISIACAKRSSSLLSFATPLSLISMSICSVIRLFSIFKSLLIALQIYVKNLNLQYIFDVYHNIELFPIFVIYANRGVVIGIIHQIFSAKLGLLLCLSVSIL